MKTTNKEIQNSITPRKALTLLRDGNTRFMYNLKANRDLLKQVIIKTAFTRLDKFWTDTTYKIDSIDVKGNDAKVSARFFVKNEPFSLDYYFLKKNGKWSVYDISYEELRYSVNINEQIDAFLKEKSFPGLLEKLKKRRAELDENSKKGKVEFS